MIGNAILLIAQGFINLLFAPLAVLNFTIDLVSSIPVVTQFLQVVVYVLPMDNLMPIILFTISMFIFRAVLSFVRLIWSFIPIIGN